MLVIYKIFLINLVVFVTVLFTEAARDYRLSKIKYVGYWLNIWAIISVFSVPAALIFIIINLHFK